MTRPGGSPARQRHERGALVAAAARAGRRGSSSCCQPARVPAEPARRARRLRRRRGRGSRTSSSRATISSGTPTAAWSRCSPRRAAARLAHGDRAARVRRRARGPGGRAVARGGRAALPRDSCAGTWRRSCITSARRFRYPIRCRRSSSRAPRRSTAERGPDEAEIPLEPLPYPVLVVTGGHEPAFDAVADVLCERLGAERLVLPGAGHAVQNAPGFNEALEASSARDQAAVRSASRRRRRPAGSRASRSRARRRRRARTRSRARRRRRRSRGSSTFQSP